MGCCTLLRTVRLTLNLTQPAFVIVRSIPLLSIPPTHACCSSLLRRRAPAPRLAHCPFVVVIQC